MIWPLQAAKPPPDPLADFVGTLGYERVELKRVKPSPDRPGHGNDLYLDVRVNGKKQRWQLDTGFSITCFDRPAGKRITTLSELDRQLDDPVLGRVRGTNFVMIDDLRLGSLRLTDQPAQVKNLGNRVLSTDMDAILGMDLLRRHYALIDFPGKGLFLRFHEPDDQTSVSLDRTLRHSGWKVVALTTDSSLCQFIEMRIGDESLRLLVDSGSDFTRLDLAVAKRLGLKPAPTRMTMGGVENRSSKSYSAWIPLAQLPGLSLTNEAVLVNDLTAWQPQGGRRIDGMIGADWLAVGSGVLDCYAGRLYLREFFKPKK